VSFSAIAVCVASERVIARVSVYFVIESVRKLFDTPSYAVLLPRSLLSDLDQKIREAGTFAITDLNAELLFPQQHGKFRFNGDWITTVLFNVVPHSTHIFILCIYLLKAFLNPITES
jgi:hypothetical protein